MSRDTIEGFLFGLGAGFLFAHIIKPAESSNAAPRDPVSASDAHPPDRAENLTRSPGEIGEKQNQRLVVAH
jgi:hypothetical protein